MVRHPWDPILFGVVPLLVTAPFLLQAGVFTLVRATGFPVAITITVVLDARAVRAYLAPAPLLVLGDRVGSLSAGAAGAHRWGPTV